MQLEDDKLNFENIYSKQIKINGKFANISKIREQIEEIEFGNNKIYLIEKYLYWAFCNCQLKYIRNDIWMNWNSAFWKSWSLRLKGYNSSCPVWEDRQLNFELKKSNLLISVLNNLQKKNKINFEFGCKLHRKNVILIWVTWKLMVWGDWIQSQLHCAHKLKSLATVAHKLLDYIEKSMRTLFTQYRFYLYSHKKIIYRAQSLLSLNNKINFQNLNQFNSKRYSEVEKHSEIFLKIKEYFNFLQENKDPLEMSLKVWRESIESLNSCLCQSSISWTELNKKNLVVSKELEGLIRYSQTLIETNNKLMENDINKYKVSNVPLSVLPIGKSICFPIENNKNVTIELKSADLCQRIENNKYKWAISADIQEEYYDKYFIVIEGGNQCAILSKNNFFNSEIHITIKQHQSLPIINELSIYLFTMKRG